MKKYKMLILFVFCIFSCEEIQNVNQQKFSKSLIGNEQYRIIYSNAIDSVKNWKKNKLIEYLNNHSVNLDSVFCFNKEKNKFVGAFLIRNDIINEKTGDGIDFFYGSKIKGEWYFFTGAHIVLPREYYQSDITKPLSFEKLHEIALKEVFAGYLKEKEKPFWVFWKPVEYEVNEAWFDYHFKGAGWGCGYMDNKGTWIDTCSEEKFNSMYKYNALSVWNK